MKTFVSAAVLSLAASAASAVTLTEADYGGFSNSSGYPHSGWTFSEIGSGYTAVSGTGEQNRHDFLHFSGLTPGAQTVTISFGYTPDASTNNRDVSVNWATSAFQAWSPPSIPSPQMSMNAANPTREVTLNFGNDTTTDLFLQINFLSGTGVFYNVTSSAFASDPSPQPGTPAVPLPAGVWLGLSALGALGLLGRRRRAA
ncbi:hypothetical protein OB2597_01357 [Pseudooceanicola batsensis HTCC2597]|uniref:Uncharacterized protein n=1 Tax=Pseudooceanicola batsensis (strain ATCC BAA-863 / DSM 15984 / KCTC 12145 / HTCC2597) TaxID=252305 RepID=A3U2W4_PSEBH|nr:hypothetical protein [Pseudooceanicola batsensis]EAQ01494.1 hypothetical protein OB2597_01357 [Pseudooceanicola batsensis HTCC2597]